MLVAIISILILFLQTGIFDAAVAKTSTPYSQYEYEYKVLKRIEKDKYKKSIWFKESGFMTRAEYEGKSKAIENIDKKVPAPKMPKDSSMKYVPQPTYKLTRYNDPPGSPELKLSRKFKFNRQVNYPGIAAPDFSILAYPAVYYYANTRSVGSDIFIVPLDKTKTDLDKVLYANVLNKLPKPIISTAKEMDEPYAFRTLTPIDFTPDCIRLLAKEKVGYTFDGIWQTYLWVYDFETQTAMKLTEVREAISYYWQNEKGENLDNYRWDIYPLGFSVEDPDRIIVLAYAYTGKKPKFLGSWSIDYQANRTELVSFTDATIPVSINGFKTIQDGVVDPAMVVAGEKRAKKAEKKKAKQEKQVKKEIKKDRKDAYKAKIKEMKKIHKQIVKDYKKRHKKSGPTS